MVGPGRNRALSRQAVLAAWLLVAGMPLFAQTAGEVEFSRGVGFAQAPGQTPRTLGRGLPLAQGDRLTTAEGGLAIVKLQDGTRMTVRPNSELVLQEYQYRQDAADNSMLMQLVRGGFRAVTGLISKNSPNAARVQTRTATIGIRGTDFDARLCAADCANEMQRVPAQPRANAVQASAKLVGTQGTVEAVDAAGQRRRLVDGGSIYPGDLLELSAASRALLIFRDDSRVTLGPNARFRVDNFVFDEANAGDGRVLVSLLRGSMRALTGLIGKANNRNVTYSTRTATVGIRGSGADMCVGPCDGSSSAQPGEEDALTIWTWLGRMTVTPNCEPGAQQCSSALQELEAGRGLFITPRGIRALPVPPELGTPRPDGMQVPTNLFDGRAMPESQEGLFVFVRDGHIEVRSATGEVLHLGRGETGFTGDAGALRPLFTPRFLEFDPTPLPGSRNPGSQGLLASSGIGSNMCR